MNHSVRIPWVGWVCLSAVVAFAQQAGKELPSVAELVGQLKSEDKFVRRDAAMYLSQWGPEAREAVPALIKALDDRETQVWFHAVTALSRIGPAAKAAVPALIDDLRNGNFRGVNARWYRSAYALGMIGPAAIPELLQGLEAGNPHVRAGVAKALGWMGEAALPALDALIGLLGDQDESVRTHASEALGRMGQSAIGSVTKALQSEDGFTRAGAVAALCEMKQNAKPAEDVLAFLAASDPEPIVRAGAVRALSALGMDPEKQVELLRKRFLDDDKGVQREVANAFLMLAPDVAVGPLIGLAAGNSEATRWRAADLLGRIGPEAKAAVPTLIEIVQPPGTHDSDSDSAFVHALVEIGRNAVPGLRKVLESVSPADLSEHHWCVQCLRSMGDPIRDLLGEMLLDENPGVKIASVLALAGLGGRGGDLAGPLRSLAQDAEPQVRAAAIRELVRFSEDEEGPVERVRAALNDASPEVRKAAAESVRYLTHPSPSLAGDLVRRLDDQAEVRIASIEALGWLKRNAAGEASPLSIQLVDRDQRVVEAVIQALGDIGEAPDWAVSQMLHLARDGSPDLKRMALNSLGKMDVNPSRLVPIFESAVEDQDASVRLVATLGLGRIQKDDARLVEVMIGRLQDADARVRQSAARTLGELGASAHAAAPKLMKLFERPEDRVVALTALRRIPPRAAAIKDYVSALSHRDPAVRVFACDRLGRLGPEASEAVPRLKERAHDRYPFVRRAASRAIARIQEEDR